MKLKSFLSQTTLFRQQSILSIFLSAFFLLYLPHPVMPLEQGSIKTVLE